MVAVTTPTSVYRYYDAHGFLLYVGITSRAHHRNQEHNATKAWWKHVVRQEVDHHETRDLALAAEQELIRKFHPPYNTHHNPGAAEVRHLYETFMAGHSHLPIDISIIRALKRQIPLDRVRQEDRRTVFSTPMSATSLAALFPAETRKTRATGLVYKVSHRALVEREGPYLLAYVKDLDPQVDRIWVRFKIRSQKPLGLDTTGISLIDPAMVNRSPKDRPQHTLAAVQ